MTGEQRDWPRSMKTVGVIGLCGSGTAICRRLSAAGHSAGLEKIAAFDSDASALSGLSEFDVVTCKSVADLVDRVDLVLLCLPGSRDVAKIVRSHEGLLDCVHQGHIIIDHGWSSLDLTRQLETAFASRGVAFLDAPIRRSGDVDRAIEENRLAFAVSGGEAAIDAALPVLGCLADKIIRAGRGGAAQIIRQLGDLVAFQTFSALAEALVTARAFGIEEASLFDALASDQGDGAHISRPGLAALLAVSDAPAQGRLSINDAGNRLDDVIQLAEGKKLALDGAKNTKTLLEKARERGLGDEGLIGLFRVIEPEFEGRRPADVRKRERART